MNTWHYPRTELAQHYLGILELGISSSLAIIAPRRKGKTLFLLQDLAPLAQIKGYLPVYASLWQNINAPHEGLITALEDALKALDKKSTISRLLKTKIKKTTLSNELLGKMEVEFASSPNNPTNKELLYLDQLLSELEAKAGKKKLLLLIDEVQHLATSNKFDALAHTLRTLLDKRQGEVKSIFTGSSRHYLDLLLNESKSPFYHFVEQQDFPDLDLGFIEFLAKKLAKDHSLQINTANLMEAFQHLDLSPYWMMKLIAQLVTYQTSLEEALSYVEKLMEATEDFAGISEQMKPIDKLIFLTLCEGGSPFAKTTLTKIEEQTELKGIAPNIQRSLVRLAEMGLISQTRQTGYNIEKPGLKRFLLGKK